MTDTLIKGQAADISPALWQKLQAAYPADHARWTLGDKIEDVANRSGHLEVLEFIARHAKLTSSG